MIDLTDDDIRWAEHIARTRCRRQGVEFTEEHAQRARVALVDAAIQFTPRGEARFRTYAYLEVYHRTLSPLKRESQVAPVSLDGPNGDGVTPLGEMIPSLDASADPIEVAQARETLDRILARCTPREERIVHLLVEGYGPRCIAQRLGVSVSRAHKLVRRLRARLSA